MIPVHVKVQVTQMAPDNDGSGFTSRGQFTIIHPQFGVSPAKINYIYKLVHKCPSNYLGRRLIDDRLLFQPPLVDFAWFLPVVLSIAAFFDSSKSSFELLAFFSSCFTFPSRCLSFISGFESTSYTHLWEKKT